MHCFLDKQGRRSLGSIRSRATLRSLRMVRGFGVIKDKRIKAEVVDSDGEVSQTALMQGTNFTNSAAIDAVDYSDSKPPIPVENMKLHIDRLSANDNYYFSEEYQVRLKGAVFITVHIFYGLCSHTCSSDRNSKRGEVEIQVCVWKKRKGTVVQFRLRLHVHLLVNVVEREKEREREREKREREGGRQRGRQTDRQTETETETERPRHAETDRERHREAEIHKERQRQRQRGRERQKKPMPHYRNPWRNELKGYY